MPFPQIVSKVLARIQDVSPVSVEDYDGTGEWFYLESDELYDSELYATLRAKWRQVTGQYLLSFALVWCREEPDSGVWLHYLPTAREKSEYLPGCHSVPSWS